MSTATAAPQLTEPQRRQLMESLRGTITAPRPSVAYRVSILLVTIAMLALPLLYIALIILTALGVCWYATHAADIFTAARGQAVLACVVLYAAPLFAGATLVLFMIKPLFARSAKPQSDIALQRQHEPALFEFVDRVARLVGAPCPHSICLNADVNASASFRRGFLSFLGSDLTLTIGLPLLAGLNMTQFAGVLAHEFGHFSQGAGMRLSFVIRRVSFWFMRLVYERDTWDDWVDGIRHSDAHWGIALAGGLATLMIWVSRLILWLLMQLGNLLSTLLIRQMEYDADRYEVEVAGASVFASTFERIALLDASSNTAHSNLKQAWSERRLCDDLCALVQSFEKQMPAPVKAQILEHLRTAPTRLFDTHPSCRDRVAAGQRRGAKGQFSDSRPATLLLSNFPAASRLVTLDFYHHVLGDAFKAAELVPSAQYIQQQGGSTERTQTAERFFSGLLSAIRPVFLPSTLPSLNREEAAERLLELRSEQLENVPAARKAAEAFDGADQRAMALAGAWTTREAGLALSKAEASAAGTSDAAELAKAHRESLSERRAAGKEFSSLLDAAAARIAIALSLYNQRDALAAPPADDALDLKELPADGTASRLLEALAVIRLAAPALEELREHYCRMAALVRRAKHNGNSQSFNRLVWAEGHRLHERLSSIQQSLRTAQYPYPHNRSGELTLARYAIETLPIADDPGALFDAARQALENVYSLYVRIMCDLAAIAEEVEASMGLSPLPAPELAVTA